MSIANKKTARTVSLAVLIMAIVAAVLYESGLFTAHKLQDGEYNIIVCSTTDVHGAYFGEDYDGAGTSSSMARFSSYISFLRSNGLDPVLIDAGDALQGDIASYYYNYVDTVSEHIFASIGKYIGYDAMIVGNHDIEAGHPVYDRMKYSYPCPFLAANAVHSQGDAEGEPYFTPYTVMVKGGVKIAVLGMTNANIKNWLSEEAWKGIDFVRISDIVQKWIDKIREKENPDVLILAMHCGAGSGKEPDIEHEGLYVASVVKGVDLVILGHDHTPRAEYVSNPHGDVFVMNAGNKVQNVAQAVISIEVKDSNVISRKVSGLLIGMDSYEADPAFNETFSPALDTVRRFACAPVGSISAPMDFEGITEGPTEVMGLIHRTQLRYSGAQISITAPLATNGTVPAGEVCFKDLSKIYRFENKLYVVEMTGEQIKGFLELAYYNNINRIGPAYNFDQADGIIYEVSLSAPKGEKVNIISMCDGTPFRPDSTYTVAMNSYRASGGGYLLRDGAGINPEDLKVVRKFKDIRSMVGDYIRECGVYDPKVPDNWKFVR